MIVIAKDKQGLTFQCDQHASSLSSAAVIVEEHLKTLANFDRLDSIFVSKDGVEPKLWNNYPETKPVNYGRYLVWRKGCEKLQFETWNNTGWAYNNNDITHWALITPPKK